MARVRDWLETAMDPGLLTKSEAEVYRLVEAKMAELAGAEGTDEGEADIAAVAAAQTQAAIQHMMALTLCPPGTTVIPFKVDESSETGRAGCYPDEPNPHPFTVMKHLDSKDGEHPPS